MCLGGWGEGGVGGTTAREYGRVFPARGFRFARAQRSTYSHAIFLSEPDDGLEPGDVEEEVEDQQVERLTRTLCAIPGFDEFIPHTHVHSRALTGPGHGAGGWGNHNTQAKNAHVPLACSHTCN